ncbi:MAG: hypothetical protein JNL98_04620 [Bryobacterales bacterium]|nr:hypothetical protein [Bryobacterales bacterium]
MLFPICSREVWEDNARQKEALHLASEIEAALQQCAGVAVDDVRLAPEHRFSLEDLRNTDRWDYDYLTYRDESGAPVDGSLV